MLTRRSIRISLAPLAMAAAVCGVSGCGLGPGDHVFYRVAMDYGFQDKSCFQGNTVPPSLASDKSSLRGSDNFILYITGDKVAELDTGEDVLAGAKTDTGYKFTGTSVNVDPAFGGGTGTTSTETRTHTVILNIDGSTVTGSNTHIDSRSCSGPMCPPDYAESCTTPANFTGVEIDDAEVVIGTTPPPKP